MGMMMSGGMGGAQAGGMNPLLMMSLLGDSCEVKLQAVKDLTASDDDKKKIARGLLNYNADHVDYDFIKCESGSGGISDLLPLMMMGGGAGDMNSMLPLMLMGDSSSSMSDLLPLMMVNGNGAAGMDPMMMMLMLDGEDTKTKKGCDSKFKIDHVFKASDNTPTKITDAAAIRAAVVADDIAGTAKSTWETEYSACLTAATEEGSSSSNSLKDLLPLMMMGGMNGQAAGGMDPMMMM